MYTVCTFKKDKWRSGFELISQARTVSSRTNYENQTCWRRRSDEHPVMTYFLLFNGYRTVYSTSHVYEEVIDLLHEIVYVLITVVPHPGEGVIDGFFQ
jgi:hypothetical protein